MQSASLTEALSNYVLCGVAGYQMTLKSASSVCHVYVKQIVQRLGSLLVAMCPKPL